MNVTLTYHFPYEEFMDIPYEYEIPDLVDCVDEWFAWGRENIDDNFEEQDMKELGLDPNVEEDRITYAVGDDGFLEFAQQYYNDDAYDDFLQDPEVQDMIEESREYYRDPYAYHGVRRSDF